MFFLCLRSKNKKKWKKNQIWWEAKICVQEYSCQCVCMCLEFDFELKYHQYVTWKWFAICIKRKIVHLWMFIGYTIYTMQRKNKYFKMTNLRIISLLKKKFYWFFYIVLLFVVSDLNRIHEFLLSEGVLMENNSRIQHMCQKDILLAV